jgi:hypothetical protein
MSAECASACAGLLCMAGSSRYSECSEQTYPPLSSRAKVGAEFVVIESVVKDFLEFEFPPKSM